LPCAGDGMSMILACNHTDDLLSYIVRDSFV